MKVFNGYPRDRNTATSSQTIKISCGQFLFALIKAFFLKQRFLKVTLISMYDFAYFSNFQNPTRS